MQNKTAFLFLVLVAIATIIWNGIYSVKLNKNFVDKNSQIVSNTVSKDEFNKVMSDLNNILWQQKVIDKNLLTFDELDYDVFTHQKWDRLWESHAQDITVHWPDGHATQWIDKHIEDLKAMFVYAPDTKIEEHPIKIWSGKYTAVMGTMQGTFSQPMPIGNGKFIEPTGKKFDITMTTIWVWNDEWLMSEEYLFWDNLTFMKQIGLAE